MKRCHFQTALESVDGVLLHRQNKTLRKHVNRAAAQAIWQYVGVNLTNAVIAKFSMWCKATPEQKSDLYNPHSLLLSLEMF